MSSTEEVEKPSLKYRSKECFRCGGKLEACEFDDIINMRIDGQLHRVAVRRVPCMKCLDCQTAVVDGTSDEIILYHYNKYLAANRLDTPKHKIKRWWRRYCERWLYWHWNRSPWARWTWPDGECPDRVKNRRWWQWW